MRQLTPFKLTEHDRACMDLLATHLGVTRAAILRLGYRALAAKEGVQLPPPPPKDAAKKIPKKRGKGP